MSKQPRKINVPFLVIGIVVLAICAVLAVVLVRFVTSGLP
jgi:hypothetical protein